MSIEIHENCRDHLERFIALNEAWIAKYFEIEDHDRALAADPASVWRKGGWIFTATRKGDEVVGCCALFFREKGHYELARMAVDPECHGQGIGRRLANHAMEKLVQLGARRVELLSNTILEPAIALYRSLGFETVFEGRHPDYSRCNIVMAKDLSGS